MSSKTNEVVRDDGATLYYSPYGWSTDLEGGYHFSSEIPIPPQEQTRWVQRFLAGGNIQELIGA